MASFWPERNKERGLDEVSVEERVGLEHLDLRTCRASLFKVGEGHSHCVGKHLEMGGDQPSALVELDPPSLEENLEVCVTKFLFKELLERVVLGGLVEHEKQDDPVDDHVFGCHVGLDLCHVARNELF